jgi:hypothetical protein
MIVRFENNRATKEPHSRVAWQTIMRLLAGDVLIGCSAPEMRMPRTGNSCEACE